MKLVAFGITTSWVLLGSTVGASASVVQYGALGLLAFVVVWTCMKGFPALLKSQKEEREAFQEAIEELKTEVKLLTAAIDRK